MFNDFSQNDLIIILVMIILAYYIYTNNKNGRTIMI